MTDLLLKGFEVELFTGLQNGEPVGVSEEVAAKFDDFVKEPDQRNLEYITQPNKEYNELQELLLEPRRRLRDWLSSRKLTILPSSTLSLGDSDKFQRSDLNNPYHDFIERTYGTKVVTASIHINLGIDDLSFIFSALRLVRCEAALFLALSASSPFLNGHPTGAHSQRWMQFPKTPTAVPLFSDHAHYVGWIEGQLKNGIMHNERHLWTSVRPNGIRRPYELNRLELRICDLVTDCDLLLAITALLELRVLSLMKKPRQLDPAKISKFSSLELADLCDMNEDKVAKQSLDATLQHWVDGKEISCRDWISQLMDDVKPLALELEIFSILSPIEEVLAQGNQAMKWLNSYQEGVDISSLMNSSIQSMKDAESLTRKRSVDYGCL